MRTSSKLVLLVLSLMLLSIIVLSPPPPFSPLAITSVAIATATNPNNNNIDKSPSFPNREIIDPRIDWIHLANRTVTKQGDRSTDIASVDYSSDGQNLNATLWVYFPFKVNQSNPNEGVRYGILIDADFDQTTGYGGIDYRVEIRRDNQSEKWSNILEKWSHYGKTRVLSNKTISYTSFSKEEANYITLSGDLDSMFSPKKYRAIFYGQAIREGSYITDFTRWVAIPPVNVDISTSPSSVELRKGEEKTIEVKVNSTHGYEPIVSLSTKKSNDIQFDLHNDTLRIPSYGVASTPLTITSSNDARLGPSTLLILANSTFPPEELIKANTSNILGSVKPENIFTQSALQVTLLEPLTLIDNVSDFWNKLGAPISFIYGIIAGVSPWFFTKIRERLSKKRGRQ